jgi:hypothetical protein
MRFMCPFCLAEGSTPASIKHHVDCPYLVAGFDLSLPGSTAILIGLTWAALIGFSVIFVVLASVLHRRNLMKGL